MRLKLIPEIIPGPDGYCACRGVHGRPVTWHELVVGVFHQSVVFCMSPSSQG